MRPNENSIAGFSFDVFQFADTNLGELGFSGGLLLSLGFHQDCFERLQSCMRLLEQGRQQKLKMIEQLSDGGRKESPALIADSEEQL